MSKLKTNVCCDVFLLQLNMTFHLFVCALAGAGAAVIAMVRLLQTHLFFQCIRVWETTVLWSEKQIFPRKNPDLQLKKKKRKKKTALHLCNVCLWDTDCRFRGEAFWCSENEKGLAPSLCRRSGMSHSLSWKLRRKALRLQQTSVIKFEHRPCLKKKRGFLIRNDALDWHLFSKFIAKILRP